MQVQEEIIKAVYKKRQVAELNYYDLELRAKNLYEFLSFLHSNNLELCNLKVLDFGCGNGSFLFDLIKSGANPENLHAFDLRTDKLKELAILHPNINVHFHEKTLHDEKFDLIILNLVFSSITNDDHRCLVAQKIKSLSHKSIFNYDFLFKNPANADVNKFTPKDFEKYFYEPNRIVKFGILPALGRLLCKTRIGRFMKGALELFPALNTHYTCGAFKK